MKKSFSKLICIVLALMLVLTSLPLVTFAASSIPQNYIDMELDDSYYVSSDDSTYYYRFIPATSGIYRFYSYGYYDSFISVYDTDMFEIASDDDGGSDGNFQLDIELEKNCIYYIKTGSFSNTSGFNFLVTIPQIAAGLYIADKNGTPINEYTAHINDKMRFTANFEPYGAAGEDIIWSIVDPSIATVDKYGNVTFKGLGSTTLKAISGKLTATTAITVEEITNIPNNNQFSITLPINSNHLCFQSDIKSDAYYRLNYEAFHFSSASIYNSKNELVATDNDHYGYIEFHSDIDDTYRIKLVYGNISEEISTNISLEKSIPAQSIDIYYEKNGKKIYSDNYNFYIDDDVTLGYTVYPENADPVEIAYLESSEPSVLEIDYNGKLNIYQEGSSTVTFYTSNGLSTSVNINISDIYYFSCNNEYNIDLNANNNGTYKVKFNTYYNPAYELNFNFKEPVDISIHSIDDTYNYLINDTATDSVKLDLSKHTEYIIEIKSNTLDEIAGSFILKSRKLASSISITDDNGNILGFYECEVGDTFKLNYELYPEDCEPENVRWYTSDEDILQVSEDGTVTALKEGSTILFVETESFSATSNISVNVKYFSELSLNSQFNSEFNIDDYENKYCFTPEESGYYKLHISGDDTNYSLNLYDENDDYLTLHHDYPTENQTVISFYLESGKKYKFDLYSYAENYKNYSAVFSAYNKPTVINITANHSDEILTSYVGFVGDTVNLNTRIDDPECYPYQILNWNSSDNSIVTVDNGMLKFHKSGTAVVTVTSRDGGSGSINIEVANDNEILLNAPTDYTFNSTNDAVRYQFIPTVSGYYSFEFDGPGHDVITQVSNASFGFVEEVMIDGYRYYKLEANSVYYFKAFFPEISGTYTFTVSKPQAADSIYITDYYDNDVTFLNAYVGSVEYFNVYSIPYGTVFGDVIWTSSDENIFKVINNEYIFCVGSGSAKLTVTSTIDEKTLTDEVTINVYETSTLPLNTETIISYENGYIHKVFSFTPEISGDFAFLSHGELDVYGDIFDSEGNSIYSDDDAGTGYNFMVKAELEANKTYYLSSRYLNNPNDFDSESSYSIFITPLVKATGIAITDENDNIITSYSASLNERFITLKNKYLPEFSFEENIFWNVDKEEIVRINDYDNERCNFEILSSGDCDITVSTESGLSATIKFTVLETPSIHLNESVEIELQNENVTYNFTPSESAWYLMNCFAFKGIDWGAYIQVYDDEDCAIEISPNHVQNQLNYFVYLNANQTYRIVLDKTHSNYMSFMFNISKTNKIVSMEILRMPYQSEIIENENGQYYGNLSGLIVRATDSNGNSDIFEYDNAIPMVTTICGHLYSTGNYDAQNGIFRATLTAGGYKLIIPFTIIENPVESIEAITARDFVFEQYTNGYWQTPDWFYYNIPSYEVYLKINYTDGSAEFTQLETFVDGEYISLNNNQYMEPWDECGTYYATITYMGRTATVPITIVPNTVEKIELADSDYILEIEEYTCGWNSNSNNGASFWYYDIESSLDTELIISYSDGNTKTVSTADIMYDLNIFSNQYESPWLIGEQSFEISYLGKNLIIPVKITDDGISNIELVKAPDVSYIYGDYTTGYLNDVDNPAYVYVPDLKPGNFELKIYYDNGTTDTKTAADLDEYGCIDGVYLYLDETYPTSIGDNNLATLEYRNYSFNYNYSIVKSNVSSVAVKKLPSLSKNSMLPDFNGMVIEVEYNGSSESKDITITSDMVKIDPEFPYFYNFIYRISHEDGDFIIGTNGEGEYELFYQDCRAQFSIENSEVFGKIDTIDLLDYNGDLYNILLTFVDGEVFEMTIDTSDACFGGGNENYFMSGGYGHCEKGFYQYNISQEMLSDGTVNMYINIFDAYAEFSTGSSSFGAPGDLNGDGEINVIDLVKAKKILAGITTEEKAPDFNGDKNFNATDLTLLRKSIIDENFLLANKIGDADGDGYVDIYDALHIACYIAGDNRKLSTMADINLDGIIDNKDKELIIKLIEV